MREGFPPEATLRLSTTRSITTYETESLDALVEAVTNSTEPGDPEILDNLVLSINNYRHVSDGQPERYNRISVDSLGVRCTVSGDPVWVKGQIASLRPLAEEVRPFKRAIWYAPRWALAPWGSTAGIWVLWIVSFATTGGLPDSFPITIASAIAGAIVGYCIHGLIATKVKVEIWVVRNDFPASFWRFTANEAVTVAIALLALAAAIIFGVISHKDSLKGEGSGKSTPEVSYSYGNAQQVI